jgi:hypothetical protein
MKMYNTQSGFFELTKERIYYPFVLQSIFSPPLCTIFAKQTLNNDFRIDYNLYNQSFNNTVTVLTN